MAQVTKGLVFGMPTAAQRHAGCLADHRAVGCCNAEIATDVQWAIWPRCDGCLLRARFLRAAVEPFKVKRPGWAAHHGFCDFICRIAIDLDPGPGVFIEHAGQSAKAV